ncbi:MAG: ATP synthase F1 subunit gamma [Sedimentisphaerales bacterium]|nr:ATP synthase F1 subunit gamma [Sedimentisphaerales bacterium]
MANTRQILQRRKAASNISKVTGTMETIAAVRYRQYYNQWAQGIEYFDALAQLAYLMVIAEQGLNHPLMKPNSCRTNAVIAIGSNRGLCGGYNAEVFRQIDTHIKMAQRFKRELKIYAKGRKVVNYLEHRKIVPDGVYSDFDEVPSAEQVHLIADHFVKQYMAGHIGRLGVIYNRFHSQTSQKVQTLTILPVTELIDDLTTRATVIWPWELAFEDFMLGDDPYTMFETLAAMLIRSALAGCFLEAATSEYLARVVSMRNASDNADQMIQDLTKDYNRARQGQITVELLDIITGVSAAKK